MSRQLGPPLLATLLLAVAGACDQQSPEPAALPRTVPADPEVVAVFDGGTVTRGDLDRLILSLPPDLRTPQNEEASAWATRLVREHVLDRVLTAGAEGDDDSELEAELRPARRRLLSDLYLRRQGIAPEPPTAAELEAAYAERRKRYARPERRQLFHLFRRVEVAADRDAVRAEVEAVRRRLLAGEPFATLAAEQSESESRHQDGLLGWLRRADLAPALADIVFAQPVAVPGAPVDATDGVHLFLVADVQAAKTFTFEEVVGALAAELRNERVVATVLAAAAELPVAPGDFTVTGSELESLLAAGAGSVVVQRTGDFRLTLGELRKLVAQQSDSQSPALQAPSTQAAELLALLAGRERIYQHCLTLDLIADPEVTARLERLRQTERLRNSRNRRFVQWLNRDQQRLSAFYERNRRRFIGPLHLSLRRLSVTPDQPALASAAMGRLEEARELLDAGDLSLEALAAELDGAIEDLGWLSAQEFSVLGAKGAAFAARLRDGEASAPYRARDRLDLLLCTGRREPEVLPYAAVLDPVREAYLAQHGQEAYREWTEAELNAVGFSLFAARLAAPDGPIPEASEAVAPSSR